LRRKKPEGTSNISRGKEPGSNRPLAYWETGVFRYLKPRPPREDECRKSRGKAVTFRVDDERDRQSFTRPKVRIRKRRFNPSGFRTIEKTKEAEEASVGGRGSRWSNKIRVVGAIKRKV